MSNRIHVLLLLLVFTVISSCTTPKPPSATAGQATVDYDLILDPKASPVSWDQHVKPVVEGRCVVCHACYDASCQLKLSSYEGLTRGGNTEKVYDGARIRASAPTRLFVDGKTTADWRAKGFHPVISEATDTKAARLEESVLYRMLRLKQLNPQPRTGMVPDAVTLELDRKQVCTTEDGFDKFAEENPLWGMPYGMPNLSDKEYGTLVRWLAQGAPPPPVETPSAGAATQIAEWERFLNGQALREKLMSRYVYEHLFVGHLHFVNTPDREFYRLVRSWTPPGEPIDEVATTMPFGDPGTRPFWYRLWLDHQSIVAKDHVVYEWSAQRMNRYRELFLTPEYEITALPSYDPELASNPLLTFIDMPVDSRYRFLLDDARFFIEGFIKGPACRGQVALNVIDDRYWVFFFSPDHPAMGNHDEFIAQVADYLNLPAGRGGGTLNVLSLWTDYWKGQKAYMTAKQAWFEKIHAVGLDDAMNHVWDGDGSNPNAALTIFRHTDSAFVMNGLQGDFPETAWIIDYPLFERIHYLLVAGFDVYGSVGHQLNTRIVMDFLRMEGENNFLAFLPVDRRKAIRDSWYQGIRKNREKQFKQPMDWLNVESVIGYKTDDPQRELYGHLQDHLGTLAGTDRINRCEDGDCVTSTEDPLQARVEQALSRIAKARGNHLQILPDAAFLRVRRGVGSQGDLAYTLILNKDYSNLTSMLDNEDTRNPDNDTLTVVPGFAASYPNFFLTIDASGIEAFTDRFLAVRSRDDYERFVALYGLRRTNTGFWNEADWFQAEYRRLDPVEAGIFDLNRYRNR
jgi:hypothetical protein